MTTSETVPLAGSEDFNTAALMAAASKETGLDNFGDEHFHEALERFVQAVLVEAIPGPMGFFVLSADVQRLLVNRLRFEEDLRNHPEILEEPLLPPIVILGLPRTGTTKLQQMMSRDPGVQRLSFWRVLNPARFPGSEPGKPDPRIAIAEGYEQLLKVQCPELMAVHPIVADEADEDAQLQELTFGAQTLGFRTGAFGFLSDLAERSPLPMYRYEYRLLQYLQWQDGGARGRPFVMKTPCHLGNLPALLEVFPDATIVHCHRDPRTTVASILHGTELARRMFTANDSFDLEEHGLGFLNFFANETRKNLAQRDELGGRAKVIDVRYTDIHEDCLGVIQDVYRVHGLQCPPDVQQLMEQWAIDSPQYRFGTYSYSLDRYGVTNEAVDKAFADYLDRFPANW